MSENDPGTVADTYFRAWNDGDFDTLRAIIDDGATFRGPLGSADSGAECVAGLQAMSQRISDINVLKRWVDGPDVITWFDLHTHEGPPVPTVNWSHVEDGRITRIRVTFDPRPLTS
jgi:hypothetical protein